MKRTSLLSKLGAFALSLMLIAAPTFSAQVWAAGGAPAPKALANRPAIQADLAEVDAPPAVDDAEHVGPLADGSKARAVVSAKKVADARQIDALVDAEVACAEKGREASLSATLIALAKKAAVNMAFASAANKAAGYIAGEVALAAGAGGALSATLDAKPAEGAV